MDRVDLEGIEEEYLDRVRQLIAQSVGTLAPDQARSLTELRNRSFKLVANVGADLRGLQPPPHLVSFHRRLVGTLELLGRGEPQPFNREAQRWEAILYLVGFPRSNLAGPSDTMVVISPGTDAVVVDSGSYSHPSLVELLAELQHPNPVEALARRASKASFEVL